MVGVHDVGTYECGGCGKEVPEDAECPYCLKEGDKVKFVDAHHAMNEDLKKHEGDVGVITTLVHGYEEDNKALVDFGGFDDRWRINKDRLEKPEIEVSFGETDNGN